MILSCSGTDFTDWKMVGNERLLSVPSVRSVVKKPREKEQFRRRQPQIQQLKSNHNEGQQAESQATLYLGIECGGTRTVVLFGPIGGGEFQRAEFGPANLRLLDDAALVKHFMAIKRAVVMPQAWLVGRALRARRGGQRSARPTFAAPSKIDRFQMGPPVFAGIVIGMAGARTERDRRRIRAAAGKVWPGLPVYATDDLETALAAAGEQDGREAAARVLILSGTGSCCFGRRRRKDGTDGGTVRLGDGGIFSATGGAATTLDSWLCGPWPADWIVMGNGRPWANLFCGSCS